MPYDFRADPILNTAYAYWELKCAGRPMPRRADIVPKDLIRILPYLQITEPIDGGARIRYRLVGTAIVNAYGAELTGKYFDEVFSGERLRLIEDNYRLICRERRPILVRNRYITRKDVELFCHRVVMPLSEDGATIHQMLTAMSFKQPDAVRHELEAESETFDTASTSCEVIR